MKYCKKPVVVEAFRVGYEPSPEWFWNSDIVISTYYNDNLLQSCTINTLEGEMMAKKGDMIIKGTNGEIYPCKKEIFDATYEIAHPGDSTL